MAQKMKLATCSVAKKFSSRESIQQFEEAVQLQAALVQICGMDCAVAGFSGIISQRESWAATPIRPERVSSMRTTMPRPTKRLYSAESGTRNAISTSAFNSGLTLE